MSKETAKKPTPEIEYPTRYVKDRYRSFHTGFYSLLDPAEYIKKLTLLCNHPSQFLIHIHEISAEPKTRIPKVLLSYAENIRQKDSKWSDFDYIIDFRIFGDDPGSMENYSKFLKICTDSRFRVLQNHRFYEIVDEDTHEFKMVVIYAYMKEREDEDEHPSRGKRDIDAWINWNTLTPVKAAY